MNLASKRFRVQQMAKICKKMTSNAVYCPHIINFTHKSLKVENARVEKPNWRRRK